MNSPMTLKRLSELANLPIQYFIDLIQSAQLECPEHDQALSEEIQQLLSGTTQASTAKKSLSLGLKKQPTITSKEAISSAENTKKPVAAIEPASEKRKITSLSKPEALNLEKKPEEKSKSKNPLTVAPEEEVMAPKKTVKAQPDRPLRPSIHLVSEDDEDEGPAQSTSFGYRQRKRKHAPAAAPKAQVKEIKLSEPLTGRELAHKAKLAAQSLQRLLKSLQLNHDLDHEMDLETASLVLAELGISAKIDQSSAEDLLVLPLNTKVSPRAPVVTIMGHVDHGKTSLIDALRKSGIAASEAGGITQHIGAYQVQTEHGVITFIDTPGHEAFSAMRARGVVMTDLVILVVAADDGVMPQTKEAIQHAKAAGVKMIVAATKMDKPNAKVDDIQQQLAQCDVLVESWGGNIQLIPLSAKTGQGLDQLLEAIILEAELMQLQARSEGAARGIVLESRLDRALGPVISVLVQEGELKPSDIVVAGHSWGKIRKMTDATAQSSKKAGPSEPVEVIGLTSTPQPGDAFMVAPNEKIARQVIDERLRKGQAQATSPSPALSLEEIFQQMREQHVLNIVLKTDTQGSLGAISDALAGMPQEDVRIKILASGVGAITRTDAELAMASKALLLGFHVRPDAQAKSMIEQRQIPMHVYDIIYELLHKVKQTIRGILGPKWKESILGSAEVREVFRSSKLGQVAGCMVLDGLIRRHAKVRVFRKNTVVFDGLICSLRRFTQDAEEVRKNAECGIGIKDYSDLQKNDRIEAYELTEIIDDT